MPVHPLESMAEVAESLGTLTHPDIRSHHDNCIDSWQSGNNFPAEVAYQLGVQTVLHRFDEARMDKRDDHDKAVTFAGIAFTLADIHFKTGHYNYCVDELAFVRRIATGAIHEYATSALEIVKNMPDTVSGHKKAPARTEISL